MGITKTYQVLFFIFSLFYLLCSFVVFCHGASSIQRGQFIRENSTLVSDGLKFEMGFFRPPNSTSSYVGIWYYNIPSPSIVWVANRENPIPEGEQGSITIGSDGDLVILDAGNNSVWSSNVSSSMNDSIAVLKDTGNLVLSNGEVGSEVYWQSFDLPTDTYLPTMRVKENDSKAFTCWKSENDPSPGKYSMGIDSQGAPQIVIWEGSKKRWRSGYWDQRIFTGIPNMRSTYMSGFKIETDEGGNRFFTFVPFSNSEVIRFQITSDGYEKQFVWNETQKKWDVKQYEPYNDCELYNKCGKFGVCDARAYPICSCMKGFKPSNEDEWKNGNYNDGCRRTVPLKSQRNDSTVAEGNDEDGFVKLKCTKVPDIAELVSFGFTETCEDKCFQNNSCTAYAEVTGIGCLIWHGELLDVQHFDNGGNTLSIRLAYSELDDGRNVSNIVIIVLVLVGVFCLGIFIWLLWRFRAKLKEMSLSSCYKNNYTIPMFAVSKSREYSGELSGSIDLGIEGSPVNGPDLPLFNFGCIASATNNFSDENKLGQGGFGPVYKGKLPSSEQIAVKRLSRRSGQGLEEFKNEMILIAKLQHRNLVRLLGCCIQGEEKMLIYEYMPNKSLDRFVFDPSKQALLGWRKRFAIIEGIARGLLYLHRDSRLRIIHRDLKASNILLDEDMNPKISDFGLARIFGGNQNEANTNRVVGTYGYMSPEYAMEGLFSVKSDVYSFGVLLLEIVSGRRNTSFRSTEHSSLTGYAWDLWSEGKGLELVDPSIRDSCPPNEVLRCIHIGMLCVQDSAASRPNMSSVVLMLESEAATLPFPRQPTMTSMRSSRDRDFYQDSQDAVSSNNLTVTMLVGR